MVTGKEKQLRTCTEGHQYYKSSDCPTCPICEAERKPKTGFLYLISAPARRALAGEEISSLEQLSEYSEKEISALHGMGPKAITLLKTVLEENNLYFKTN
ncbi:RNA polymerase alpha subunit C-terminal domain-containing protein [Roseivirga echinicomitans]|uniref:RNA polymerase alpha subunit C-terminal domain-containing protein n=1 Tax=Roseivirga echinicomitans TaxID=296218 RepID=A0A150X9I4_9BACT|nr:RNA polymerase alpha subunit C-terminal domain-containing protein [Roseivirga echinicomitans]KYG75381.1 hypothetical protein AWN68_07475 [Roseivirga echinicomitans]